MIDQRTAEARIAAGYAQAAVDPATSRRHDRAIAAGFREHVVFERLIAMPDGERDAMLERMGPDMRISFGYYKSARAAHNRVEQGEQV
jgi:hypothetical protein